MSNHIKILFWLNKSKLNKKGLAPLLLRITYRNERKQLATGFNVEPSKWDSVKSKVRGKDAISSAINDYILTAEARLKDLFTSQLKQGDVYLDKVIDQFLGRDEENYTLMQLIQYQMKHMEARLGKDYAIATIKKYKVTVGKLEKFLWKHLEKKDVRLKDLSLKFIQEFDLFMKTELGNDHNTTVKHIKNLKTFINVAILNGWMDRNPFIAFKAPYKIKEKVFLNESELAVLKTKKFHLERLSLVRDLFLFQCYTGLAFSDMANLKGRDVTIGIDGKLWIITYRQKTNIRCSIPLLPPALKILEQYNPEYRIQLDKQLLPLYSNQKFNSYLKEIADFCGIAKELSSHAGRRTFATTIALANGISIETIRSVIGHTQTSKITYQYAAITDMKVSSEMQKLAELTSK